jgi:hypothetical protein
MLQNEVLLCITPPPSSIIELSKYPVPSAYKEKMKELSVLSLICSCFYPETHNKLLGQFEGMDPEKFIPKLK